ncbi:MFS transporter [Fodinicola acaciae]|uniref:MFS transporter n=1 Tax=Fodinicola acaciae TaxID=2681555 RepID=UPI0013D4A877|nr:MFS transporter [Fodinicola acaciae]
MSDDYPPGQDPRRWRALAVTLLAGFMGLLDVSIVNVAFPSMQHALNASLSDVQWVVSGYALTFGLALVAGGRLGDGWGRKRMFLIALAAFILTSVLAGAATTALWLVMGRLLQGFAAGLLTPQNSGLIQELFRGAERGRAFGLFGATVGISTAVGPVLGGLILAVFGAEHGWRWVFYVNVPIGAVALLLAMRLLPGRQRKSASADIDVVGALLLGLAVVGVLFPLVQSENHGLAKYWWMFPIAAVLGFAFIRWEARVVRRGRAPLLDVRLFTQTPGYSAGAAIGAVYFCGFAGIWLVMALFFQDGLHYTPLESGLAVTPFAIGSAVAAVVAGRAVARWGRKVTVAGLVLVVLGLASVAVIVLLVPPSSAGFGVAFPLLVAGVGGGAVISPNTTLTLECVPTRMAGVAGGALQTGQRVGTAIGTAVLAAAYRAGVGEGNAYERGASAAMFGAVAVVLVALGIALWELWSRHSRISAGTATTTETAAATDVHRS